MSKDRSSRDHSRERLAHQAAKLIAEDGLVDFGAAKRKAARQLGLSESKNLPTNEEIELALHSYQALFRPEEHRDRLLYLRRLARDTMRMLEPFRPVLLGGLVTGSIGSQCRIPLHLFADSAKEVELHLINQTVPFVVRESRIYVGGAYVRVPGFCIETEEGDIDLSVLSTNQERQALRAASDGRPLPRTSLADLEALLAEGPTPCMDA